MVGNERNSSDEEDDGLQPPEEGSTAEGKHIEQRGSENEAPDLREPIDTEQDHFVEEQQDGGKVRVTPNLSLDTSGALKDRYLEVESHRRALTASNSPQSSPGPRPPAQSLRFSPVSPRPRDRSFSLRKQLFTRNVHGEPEGSRSAIELQPAVHNASSNQRLRHDSPKKSGTTVTVSPITQGFNSIRVPERTAKSSQSPSALPHYETWLRGSVTRSGIFSKLKAAHHKVRNVILRIQELPPSKDGRQLTLCIDHTKARIDERTNREYVDNTIRSCKYTLWNFLPRQLYAQFSKLANFYFLCVSILQMIPGLSTTGTYTTIGPLAFFVMLSMAKEGYDDIRRYKLDKTENNKLASVLRPQRSLPASDRKDDDLASVSPDPLGWGQTKWKDVQVGDVVRLTRDEATPADLVILQAKGLNGISYVETMALDGETNLKSKQASPALAKNFQRTNDILESKAHIVVEDPNLDLYNFEGKITAANETLPLTNNEIIYRGSVIRNTPEVLGMVIYTGEECKIRMNATKNPRIKAPALQAVVNKVVIIIVLFVLALAIFNTVAYQIWRESTEDKSWYLVDASVSFFPILASFIIIFNTMIPLSLYVSLEIVKLFQLVLMHDIEMYDEESNTPMEARTSTINEELGQVNYIFSDKTGTLTENSMRFRKMSIAGTAWLHDADVESEAPREASRKASIQKRLGKGKAPLRTGTGTTSMTSSKSQKPDTPGLGPFKASPAARQGSIGSPWKTPAMSNISQPGLRTTALLSYIQSRPHSLFARKARFFLLSIALCHTCLPEKDANGEIGYQAASPDELALVRAAQELGFVVVDRQSGTITIRTNAIHRDTEYQSDTYQILDVIEFSSARKRMSIIVRMPDHRICVFCKGADSTIIPLLRLSSLAEDQAFKVQSRVARRQSLEAQQAIIRRDSEHRARKDSMTRTSLSIHRPSLAIKRLQPIKDELDDWLKTREGDVNLSPNDSDSVYYSPRPSAHSGTRYPNTSIDGRPPSHTDDDLEDLVEESLVINDAAVFERCFQHTNDFATEGLRTLLYAYKYLDEEDYNYWQKYFLEASTSLVDRQRKVEEAGAMVEKDLELVGATAIEDKLQKGIPETIDKLRRANIRLWVLTGDKRETAINVARAARVVKDYSSITILDHEAGDLSQRIAAAALEIDSGLVAHSVIVIDGQTLGVVELDQTLKELFMDLAVQVDSVICCRASPSQKSGLVHAIRKKVGHAITLAIGDGANDIAMIQEAHVGIGITGKEGLQAARTSDYSIAQFRFLLRLLLVHGRWNYVRTCKYTLGTFWKEFLFYLTQGLYQRWVGYTGTSLYESMSLSMFNTLFTSLPVIFMGIFEQDLSASTLLAVPELYTYGHRNGGFNLRIYAGWIFMASSQAMVVYFLMMGLYGKAIFTDGSDLYSMGVMTFTACIIVIATKMQFFELHNKTITCVIAMIASIGGWFIWNLLLSILYTDNVIYGVRDGFLERFGRNALWWLTLFIIVIACWCLEIGVKALKVAFLPEDADVFRELEKDDGAKKRLEQAAKLGTGAYEGEDEGNPLAQVRTLEEEERREGEVQELLNRPRVMSEPSGMRRRQLSTDIGHDLGTVGVNKVDQPSDEDDDNDNGKSKEPFSPKRSVDIQELLRKGFGSVRRSLDVG